MAAIASRISMRVYFLTTFHCCPLRFSSFRLCRIFSTYTSHQSVTQDLQQKPMIQKSLHHVITVSSLSTSSFLSLSSSSSNPLTISEGYLLLVVGVLESTTEAKIKEYFEKKFGEVLNVVEYPDMSSENLNDRIVYISFKKPSSLREALETLGNSKASKNCLDVKKRRIIAEFVPFAISKDRMRCYVEKFGPIYNIVPVFGSKDSNSWIIDFKGEDSAANATKRNRHTIDGHNIHIERDSRNRNSIRRNLASGYKNQVKIQKLPCDVTVDDIRVVCERYGVVMAVDLDPQYDTDNGFSLGAWVTFDSSHMMNIQILKDEVIIGGQRVDVSDSHTIGLLKKSKANQMLVENIPEKFSTKAIIKFFETFGNFFHFKLLGLGYMVVHFKNTRSMKYFTDNEIFYFDGKEIKIRKMAWKASSLSNIPATKRFSIGNLPPHMEVSKLAKYLSSFGDLKSVNMILFKQGIRSPRAFIEYNKINDLSDVVATFKAGLGDVFIKALAPNAEISDRSNRLVIENVPENVSEEMLHSYLEQFGEVEKLNYRTEADTSVYYLTFKDSLAVERIKKEKNHFIDGQEITFYYLHWSSESNQMQV